MFSIFKNRKIECDNCKREFKKSKLINYAGINICSEDCMLEYFANISTEELLNLEKKDREINKDFYNWMGRCV